MERIDDLQRNGLKIIQDTDRFCFGMDGVLLSGFAKAKKGDKVLDMGTGTGIIPILMTAKTEAMHFYALEIQKESADIARRSVELNNLAGKIDVVTGDIKEASKIFGRASFDVVTTNPPYMTAGTGEKNPDPVKAIARHEIMCTLSDVVREASLVLKTNGYFYMVHKPDRLAEIIKTLMDNHLMPKSLRIVYPYADKAPNMILICARKGGNLGMKIEPPLILYKEKDVYTDEVRRDYGF